MQGQHDQHGAHQDRGGGGKAGIAQLRGEAGLVDVLREVERAGARPAAGQHVDLVEDLHRADQRQHDDDEQVGRRAAAG